jgi:hypothetical protein
MIGPDQIDKPSIAYWRDHSAGASRRRGYEAALWVSFVMPSASSPTIIARLNREVNEILKSTDGTEALVAQGMGPEPGPPEALTERIRGDIREVAERRRSRLASAPSNTLTSGPEGHQSWPTR